MSNLPGQNCAYLRLFLIAGSPKVVARLVDVASGGEPDNGFRGVRGSIKVEWGRRCAGVRWWR